MLALAVRWYARFRLSHADVAEWLAERGFVLDRTAISRWVQRFLPLFGVAARRHRRRVGRKDSPAARAHFRHPRARVRRPQTADL